MKTGSYKHTYPRTLLADVLSVLMNNRGVNVAVLEKRSGVNRGTIHSLLTAQRSIDSELRRMILKALLNCDNLAMRLSACFDGDAAELLAVADLLLEMEPRLTPQRQVAMQQGLDLGALAGKYSLEEIYRDALAMEQGGKWTVACRWASLLAAAACHRGDVESQLRGHLLRAHTLLASSQFTEARSAIAQVRGHPSLQTPHDDTGPNCHFTLLRIHADIYLGWLDYEIGQYARAIECLNGVLGMLEGLCAATSEGNGDGDLSLNVLKLLRQLEGRRHQFHYCSPLELLNMALHLRAKVFAERAIYIQEYTNEREMFSAARALMESMAVTSFTGGRGMLGHGMLWLARLIAAWMANIGADGPDRAALLSLEIVEILQAAQGSMAVVLPDALNNGEYTPKRLLSIASRECFDHFQSSLLARGYYQRAKGAVLALEGDYSNARSSFEDAYEILALHTPDARGLGPLLYERYILQTYGHPCGSSGDQLDWLLAAAAVHPTEFIVQALYRERHRSVQDVRYSTIKAVSNHILAFQKPFGPIQRLGTALWGDMAVQRLQNNINFAMRSI